MRGATGWIGVAMLAAAPAFGWEKMDAAAPAGHHVTCREASQSLAADGSTVCRAENPGSGHWRDEGGRYCSVWPPSDHWVCYRLERDGQKLRFVADDGSVTEGVID